MHSTIVPVPARRHPYQVFVGVLLFLGGLPILLGGPRPGSINEVLPPLLVYVWAFVLVAGGALLVVAAVVPSPVTALYVERVAHAPIALMCGVYATSLLAFVGLRAAFSAGIVAGVAVAAVVRAVQVSRTIRTLRKAINDGGEAQPWNGGKP